MDKDIIYVDDSPDDFMAAMSEEQISRVKTVDPWDEKDVQSSLPFASTANLWIFDFFYGSAKDEQELTEENGLSAFAKWRRKIKDARPVTTLVSGDLENALDEPIISGLRHIAAQSAGVEWIANKADAKSVTEVFTLADAASELRQLVQAWLQEKPQSSAELISASLKMPETKWKRTAERQIDRSRPPHLKAYLSKAQAGVSENETWYEAATGASRELLAWLLHKVLPYQSFLLNERQVAVRLGVTLASLKRLLENGQTTNLYMELSEAIYEGPLANFDGPRWWRAGIDHIVWKASKEDLSFAEAIQLYAQPTGVECLTDPDPVIVSNADLVETDKVADASECVRAQDEHFPADVPPAWVLRVDAQQDASLRAKVLFEDQEDLAVPEESTGA